MEKHGGTLEEDSRSGRPTKKERHRGALETLTHPLAEDLESAFLQRVSFLRILTQDARVRHGSTHVSKVTRTTSSFCVSSKRVEGGPACSHGDCVHVQPVVY